MSQISMAQARTLTAAYLRDWMSKLPVAQRTGPSIVFDMRTWSLADMLAQVQSGTPTGNRYAAWYVGSLKNYVIVG